eukprot:TRINITY_DN11017_c0_g1_i1.p1 TRINITY_DN11017_c0_g1~~TRINITY_DN11017_c0_g1_i1.p1  ORF type:complete len:281 (-),score=68.03 TRINITY_DN11017_c0_g1_i1:44-886(-)
MSALQPYWDQILQSWNILWTQYAPVVGFANEQSEHIMFSIFMTVALGVTFYSLNILLYLVYHFDLCSRHKIARGAWPDRRLVVKTLAQILPGHIFLRPFVFYILFPFFKRGGMPTPDMAVPSWTNFAMHFAINIALNDTLFYWLHRMLHHRLIYKHIHKKHHEYNVNIGIAVEYAHPIEEIFVNGLSMMAGPMCLGAHPLVTYLWLVFRMFETVDAHCGYAFPLSPFCMFPSIQGGARRHDYHHSHTIGNYGSFFAFWDWICGTDKSFREYIKKQSAKSE